ncbi:hypothetical protein [Cupriavidus sp. AcVe19-1a]|uniref:hypothetical protein n=1 Tax=Cupriavidus sp. AcVe19-1a TaxID=2821359 RepID=UPI001AE42482|nr:hypothetical protein [Cupriavidus sp. AcVe19-1a]MBP0632346.1 hypothetical protein [Cupriavidus sp. AcVe19-1a]
MINNYLAAARFRYQNNALSIRTIYWAANGGNWGLAQYQLKELLEAQEVGEITRPQHASMLKANEKTYLTPVAQAIEKKNRQI